MLPKITRPRFAGRLYATTMFAPPIVALTVSGGDTNPAGPLAFSAAAQPNATRSKSRPGAVSAIVLTVVAVALTPRILPRESTRATSIQFGNHVLLNATESVPLLRRMIDDRSAPGRPIRAYATLSPFNAEFARICS